MSFLSSYMDFRWTLPDILWLFKFSNFRLVRIFGISHALISVASPKLGFAIETTIAWTTLTKCKTARNLLARQTISCAIPAGASQTRSGATRITTADCGDSSDEMGWVNVPCVRSNSRGITAAASHPPGNAFLKTIAETEATKEVPFYAPIDFFLIFHQFYSVFIVFSRFSIDFTSVFTSFHWILISFYDFHFKFSDFNWYFIGFTRFY